MDRPKTRVVGEKNTSCNRTASQHYHYALPLWILEHGVPQSAYHEAQTGRLK
jgi:hypothetical protein